MLAHQQCLLVRSALLCGMNCLISLPVFDQSDQSGSCVGVVECCVDVNFVVFVELKLALERVGLSTFNVEESREYKSIGGLNYAKDEIEEALEIVCESHNLILAQVWIPFEKTHVVKLTDDYVFGAERYDVPSNNAKYLYVICSLSKMGRGLIVWKTLQTYEPHFCRDTSKMSGSGLLWLLSTLTKCSIFMICLRSIDTGDLDYVFEFLWPQSRNYFVMLQTVLATLKWCFPSFKFASGAEIGDEFSITDVENSTGTGIGFFKIFEENRLSLWKKCGNVRSISEWQRLNFVKRKLSELSESQTDSSTANDDPSTNINWKTDLVDEDDDNDDQVNDYVDNDAEVLFMVLYKINVTIILPSSSAFAYVKEEINERLKLDHGSYMLEYEVDDGKWLMLNNDEHFASCIRNWRGAKPKKNIHLRVLPSVTEKN